MSLVFLIVKCYSYLCRAVVMKTWCVRFRTRVLPAVATRSDCRTAPAERGGNSDRMRCFERPQRDVPPDRSGSCH